MIAIENGRKNGKFYPMKSTIDSAGRLLLPKPIREAANLEGGTEVEIRVTGDHLEIEPVPAEVSLVQKGDFIVAVPKRTLKKKLTAEEVEEVRSRINMEPAGVPDTDDLSS
jgi:AbrB family looped-hinge helix DNA binding protein